MEFTTAGYYNAWYLQFYYFTTLLVKIICQPLSTVYFVHYSSVSRTSGRQEGHGFDPHGGLQSLQS